MRVNLPTRFPLRGASAFRLTRALRHVFASLGRSHKDAIKQPYNKESKMTKSNTTTANAPTHIAYTVNKGGEKSYWRRIGVAFAHKDGNGFNIVLESLPIDGKITLRTVSEE